MATTSAVPPPVKAETLPASTPMPLPPATHKRQETENTYAVGTPPPHLVKSFDGLRSLSTALSLFLSRYDELHDHLEFIRASIDSKLPKHLLLNPNPNPNPNLATVNPLTEASSANSKTPASPQTIVTAQIPNGIATDCEQNQEISRKPEGVDVSKKPEETDVKRNSEETDVSKKHGVSELESLCEGMSGRGVKKYIAAHISDMNKLREEVPKALRLAKNPAKLVLQGVGRFFMQGRSCFKGSEEILRRLAIVVLLECFLMISSDIEIANEEEEHAAKAAVDWRNRMIHEGGLGRADETDARGLLLFISGFGIPNGVFKNEDIRDLIRASNVKEISTALRRSVFLIPKIPEMIDWMVKNNLEIEAVDVAYTFGLEDKCPPRTILTTFLRNNIKDKQHGSSAQARKAIKKQLAEMKSLTQCLKSHNVNPSVLLPDFKINEITSRLEKESKGLDSKAAEEASTQKRKPTESEPSRNPKHQEPKRTRLGAHKNAPEEFPDEPKTFNRSYFDGRFPSDYVNSYPTPSVSRGSESRLTGSHGGDVYGAPVADQMVRGGATVADQMVHGQAYDWHEDTDLVEKYLGRNYSRRIQTYDSQPPTGRGLIGSYNRPLGSSGTFAGLLDPTSAVGGAARVGGSGLYNRPLGSSETFAGLLDPTSAVGGATRGGGSGLYNRPLGSSETFAGLPDPTSTVGGATRGGGSASDLYRFADSVVEREANQMSGGPRALGSGTMRSSYLY